MFVSLGKNISSSQKTCTSTLVYDKMGGLLRIKCKKLIQSY